MKYSHFYQQNGDSIIKNLLLIRENMGDSWTENMAFYAIKKACNIAPLKWREPVNGLNYRKIQFVEV